MKKIIVELELTEGLRHRDEQKELLREILSKYYIAIEKVTVIRPYEEKIQLK
jgi:hypothetical protein